jgi:competence protein ComFC
MGLKERFFHIFSEQIHFAKGSLLDFIFPPVCAICENELKIGEQFICGDCYLNIEFIESHFCHRCGAPLERDRKTCRHCRGIKFHFEKVRAVATYVSPLSEMIHFLKYNRKTHIANRLGIFMGNVFQSDSELFSSDIIVPVPLHRARKRERGYNQSKLLAQVVSDISGKTLIDDSIIRKKATKSQTMLAVDERVENLRDAFAVVAPEKIKGKNIVIIDDVLTTGTTLEEMAKTLIREGAASVSCLVLARAIKK